MDVTGINFFAVETDYSVCRLIESENASSDSRFAAARLADKTQGLTGIDRKRDVINGFQGLGGKPSVPYRELLFEVFNFQQMFSHLLPPPLLSERQVRR